MIPSLHAHIRDEQNFNSVPQILESRKRFVAAKYRVKRGAVEGDVK